MTTHDEAPSPEEKKERASFRKTFASGLSALLSNSEEGLRGRLGDLKVSREWAQFLQEQGKRARHDVVQVVSREVRRAARGVDVPGELRRALAGMKIQLRADISFDSPAFSSEPSEAKKKAAKDTEEPLAPPAREPPR